MNTDLGVCVKLLCTSICSTELTVSEQDGRSEIQEKNVNQENVALK